MYLQPEIARSQAPMRRKIAVPAPGGGLRVYADLKERPFARLAPEDLLDTADLCRLYGVSLRTVYRWMAEHNLKPQVKVGREYLFRKAAILEWDDNDKPVMGRPWGG